MRDEPDNYDEGRGGGSVALRVLGILAFALVLVIAAGSVWGLATGSRGKAQAKAAATAKALADGQASLGYDILDLGQVRAKSADSNPAAIAARISLPYPAGDSAFREELAKKAPALRDAAARLLASKRAADLAPSSEGALKAALKDEMNAILSLGKVGTVWLTDFAVIQ